jgi:putative inorganic carbon (hco3(-)) transporter
MNRSLVLQKNELKYALWLSLPFLLFFLASCYEWQPQTAFILLAGLSALLIIFLQPIWGLLLCLVVIFSGFVWGLGIKQGFLPIALLSIAAVICRKIYTFDFSLILDRQMLYIAGFLGFVFVSIIGAWFPLEAMQFSLLYIKLIIIYFLVIYAIAERRHLWFVTATLIGSNLLSTLYGFYNFFFARQSLGSMAAKVRMRGLTDDPNILALGIVFIAPALLLLLFDSGWRARSLLYLSALFCMLAGLIASFSRGGTIALAVVLAIALYMKRSWKIAGFVLACAIILIVFVIPATFWQHLLTLFDLGKYISDPSLRWRSRLMLGAFDLFLQHPIFGIGVGNFVIISNRYVSLENLAVHNSYLHAAVETGIFGLIFFLLIFARSFQNFAAALQAFRKQNEVKLALLCQGMLIGLVGIVIDALFLSVQEAFIIWVIFALSVAFRHVAQMDNKIAFAKDLQ